MPISVTPALNANRWMGVVVRYCESVVVRNVEPDDPLSVNSTLPTPPPPGQGGILCVLSQRTAPLRNPLVSAGLVVSLQKVGVGPTTPSVRTLPPLPLPEIVIAPALPGPLAELFR